MSGAWNASPLPPFRFGGLDLLAAGGVSPMSPSGINLLSPPSGLQTPVTPNQQFALNLPFQLSDQYDLVETGTPIENDPRTQEETDMSATEDDAMHDSPLPTTLKPSEEDRKRADAWFADLGIDCDQVKFDMQRLQQARAGLLNETAVIRTQIGCLGNLMKEWAATQSNIKLSMQTLPDHNTDSMADGIAQVHAGFDQVMACATEQKGGFLRATALLQAKLAAIQEVFAVLEDGHHIPCCPICAVCPADRAAQPCGHMYCEECSKKMMRQPPTNAQTRRSGSKPCYICRTQCKGFLKTHFS